MLDKIKLAWWGTEMSTVVSSGIYNAPVIYLSTEDRNIKTIDMGEPYTLINPRKACKFCGSNTLADLPVCERCGGPLG